MNVGNTNKAKALGMPYGTANNKLRKALLFRFAKLLGLDTCYQCKTPITELADFSIEHKIPWMGAKSPSEAFFDLDNIAFSHLVCNAKAGEKRFQFKLGHTDARIPVLDGTAWCGKCGEQPIANFTKNKFRWNGLQDLCRPCRSKYRKG